MNNERDTKFAGFAKLLWDELRKNSAFDTMVLDFLAPVKSPGPAIQPAVEQALQAVIAQRAYDLACHVLYETSYGMDKWDITGRVNNTPDLTQWPDVPEPRLLDRSTWPTTEQS